MRASGARIAQQTRGTKALAMRVEGATFAEIASALGYANPSGAYKAVSRTLTDIDQELSSELRGLQLARLETLLAEVWPMATSSRHPRQIAAVHQLLNIMERMNRVAGVGA